MNEAEINYKAARNKRLHVELALIKLTYLQQAIELSQPGEGVGKKKLIESARPVAYRNLPVIHTTAASSKISRAPKNDKPENGHKDYSSDNAKLIIQSTGKKELVLTEDIPDSNTTPVTAATKPEQVVTKIGKLQNIRDKFANKSSDNSLSIIPLTAEKLLEAWRIFTEQLKEKKNPAAQSFDLAILNIIDEGRFEVITNNNLEQRFIEQEKRKLCEYLQALFVNKSLTLEIKIKENPDVFKPDEKHLSKRDQYQKIIEQYPLVKELKDKLRMELDY